MLSVGHTSYSTRRALHSSALLNGPAGGGGISILQVRVLSPRHVNNNCARGHATYKREAQDEDAHLGS